jgi:hypothetical protein
MKLTVNFVMMGICKCYASFRIGSACGADGYISKRYSACGARLGAFVTKNKEFIILP